MRKLSDLIDEILWFLFYKRDFWYSDDSGDIFAEVIIILFFLLTLLLLSFLVSPTWTW